MEKRKLYVYPHKEFDNLMNYNNWSNDIPDDVACISICNTSAVKDDYLANDCHWFKNDSDNIINLDFDDITVELDENTGCVGINKEQAETLLQFIMNNYGKDFYIHCSAGKSRSQGVARFILDCNECISELSHIKEVVYQTRDDNPCITPNYFVVSALKNSLRNLMYN